MCQTQLSLESWANLKSPLPIREKGLVSLGCVREPWPRGSESPRGLPLGSLSDAAGHPLNHLASRSLISSRYLGSRLVGLREGVYEKLPRKGSLHGRSRVKLRAVSNRQ